MIDRYRCVHTPPLGLQVGARARGALDRVKEEAERQEAEVSFAGCPFFLVQFQYDWEEGARERER